MNLKRFLGLIVALTVGLAVKAQAIARVISNQAQLIAFAEDVNNGTFGDGEADLTDNIDLHGYDWTPIGTSEHPFKGRFYGNNHKISQLTVNTDGLYAGLFGYVDKGAEVKEVHIMSGSIAVKKDPGLNASYHGGIAGYNLGSINKCSNRATVSGSDFVHARIGGIVGENGTDQDYSGVIRNCYNLGDVYSSKTEVFIGGIAGNNHGYVYNCFMRSNVLKGIPSSSSPYPLYGNNAGTVTGCFYAGGATTDVSLPIAIADGSDNSTTLSGDNLGSGKNVLLSGRTLYTDTGWNTLCLPFDIPAGATGYSPIAGAKVMTLSSSSYSTSKGYGELTLNFVDATSIEAGKPYIVKWDTDFGNLSNPVFLNVTVSNTTQTTETTCVVFVGSFSPVAIAAEDNTMLYLGADNKLFYPSSTMTINSCRAYFRLKDDLVAGEPINITAIKSFNLNFGDEETTGIINLETNHSPLGKTEGASWYDLSGRKLQELKNLHPGLYIYNGRKVLIK